LMIFSSDRPCTSPSLRLRRRRITKIPTAKPTNAPKTEGPMTMMELSLVFCAARVSSRASSASSRTGEDSPAGMEDSPI
jgi:hypothetical protein